MVEYDKPRAQIGFDARLHWNEVLGHCLEDIRLNRISGQYQAWLRSIWTLADMGSTYLDKEKNFDIGKRLDNVQRLIFNYENIHFNDISSQERKKRLGFIIEKQLSDLQVLITKSMGEKGMFLPLKVPLDEWNENDLSEGMGL